MNATELIKLFNSTGKEIDALVNHAVVDFMLAQKKQGRANIDKCLVILSKLCQDSTSLLSKMTKQFDNQTQEKQSQLLQLSPGYKPDDKKQVSKYNKL